MNNSCLILASLSVASGRAERMVIRVKKKELTAYCLIAMNNSG